MRDLSRLLHPRSIAVIGGGAWCENVIREGRKMGFDGPVWPVHPRRDEVGGLPAFARIEDLPEAPDAVFIGINREATVAAVRVLSARGAGGAICFASGFAEARAELADGADLQAALSAAAGDMPVLGPNCYGFLNALDRVALWPDQHGMVPVERGVAILSQSSNVALNLTMQRRGLPIGFLGTVGNQAQVDLSALGMALLEDDRITALGLYIEGIKDVRGFEALAARARNLGKRIVALKLGASEQAGAAAVSHTASLTGNDAGARAFLRRIGVAQVTSLSALLEVLKILHVAGPLRSNRVVSASCSGGEASLMADTGLGYDVEFPPLGAAQREGLRAALGAKVALANPLDYHTYIWGDVAAMRACFGAMIEGADLGLGVVVLDFPRGDRCSVADWDLVIEALAGLGSSVPMAILSSLVETLPEAVAERLVALGIVPLCDVPSALEAVAAAAFLGRDVAAWPVLLESGEGALPPSPAAPPPGYFRPEEAHGGVLSEGAAKQALARAGVRVPGLEQVATPAAAGQAAARIGFPVVVKGEGFAHKSEAGAVRLNLMSVAEVEEAAGGMGASGYLVEEMVAGAVVELLVGVVRDPAHGFVLTLGAGGVWTEILGDTQSLLLPVTEGDVRGALGRLRIAPLLAGYRGAAGADMAAIAGAVLAVQALVAGHAERIEEVEINPLLCMPDRAVAADALIRLRDTDIEGGEDAA
ncbi:acetate--CoA ligase family protein [Antarctobacter heliothermus]|uniref:Acyl-CoA synthetase (NDP forming) n=1 Tax=Antarctobacter heliothermus TaxID=74033 RepID=A0A239HCY5_9RHOB|nr:acetate--CoA ligase family protein [Antarctobacter heliothermus]SNS78878.1 Acyl-CoA synthetase (NDP forming) [Antarctobacter heliothermus]